MLGFLFICILALFLIGAPIFIALGMGTTITILLSGSFPLELVPQRMFAGLDSWPIMAIPMFMLAGNLMDQGGMSKRIVNFANASIGFVKGSLAMVCVFASMIFAAISGSATAGTAAIGSIMSPAMREKGYNMSFVTVVLAAAGSIGPIIPPSILMVLIGYSTGASVGQLFLAGFIPGVMIGIALMIYSYIHASRGGGAYLQTTPFDRKETTKTLIAALPGLGLPIIIIGGISGGIFSATEAAAVAVLYGFIIGMFVYKEITIKDLPGVFIKSAQTASTIMIITATAYIFAWYITAMQLPQLLITLMNSFITTKTMFLVFLNVALFIVGMFMESFSAIIVLMPILFPVATSYGIDPIHFGVIVCVNLAIGYVTPPYGATLFVSCGLTGKSVREVLPYVVPVIISMLIVLMIVTYFPQTYMWLPQMMAK